MIKWNLLGIGNVHVHNYSKFNLQQGSMSQVVGLPNNSYKPITNMVWVRARLCKKGCTRLVAASDKVYQLFAHGRWFFPCTPASSTSKTGRHDIAERGVKHNKSTKHLLKLSCSTLMPLQHNIQTITQSSIIRKTLPQGTI